MVKNGSVLPDFWMCCFALAKMSTSFDDAKVKLFLFVCN